MCQHRCPCEMKPKKVTTELNPGHWSLDISMTDVMSAAVFLHMILLLLKIKFPFVVVNTGPDFE